jgi:hypothetical protein
LQLRGLYLSIPELLGYIATVVVAVSLMMKNIVKLRWINFSGAILFAIYGALIEAWPVLALNLIIGIIDAYHLYVLKTNQKYFDFLAIADLNHPLIKRFLSFYRTDMALIIPAPEAALQKSEKFFLILRNLQPVGLFTYSIGKKNDIFVHVDYVAPDYRDMHNSRFVFSPGAGIIQDDVSVINAESGSKAQAMYFRKAGFTLQSTDASGIKHWQKPWQT